MNYLENIGKLFKNNLIENFLLITLFIVLIFFSVLSASCSNSNVRPETIMLQQPSLKAETLNADLFKKKAELTKNFSSADYKVGPDDLLEIEVFGIADLKTTVRISSSGYIKLPLGDTVQAKDLTVSELEKVITEALKKYVNEPMVTVFVREYRSQQITVIGYVKTPGIYYVSGQKSLLDVLSLAGGLLAEGGDVCLIQRASADDKHGDKKMDNIVIDMNELLTNGRSELNIPVYSGDIIHVPKSGVFFVDGAVGGPGLFPLKGKITLMQALSMAKGLNYEASRGDIKIFRDNGKPEREVITASYDDIANGNSKDVDLKDKDIVIVDKSGIKTILKGIAGSISYGMFSLGKAY